MADALEKAPSRTDDIDELLAAMAVLRESYQRKATEFADVLKMGRTQLQDAVPMTLGQEFAGYTQQIENGIKRIEMTLPGRVELTQGGTAEGTGLEPPE